MARTGPVLDRELPDIPVIEHGGGGLVGLAEREAGRLRALIHAARRQFTPPVLATTDYIAHRWFERARNPYLDEMEAIARRLQYSGVFGLNLSYEWACTGAVGPDPDRPGSRLVHSLDWIQHGIGRNAVVAVNDGPIGKWFNLTWPGFVGTMKGLAPGRFAAAINQPPVQRRLGLLPLDWAINRVVMWRSIALPASHLLREVFDTCGSYAEARARLGVVPVCTPAVFLLAGIEPSEAVVIERLDGNAVYHDGPIAAGNHWLTTRFGPGSVWVEPEQPWLGLDRISAEHVRIIGPFVKPVAPGVFNPTVCLHA